MYTLGDQIQTEHGRGTIVDITRTTGPTGLTEDFEVVFPNGCRTTVSRWPIGGGMWGYSTSPLTLRPLVGFSRIVGGEEEPRRSRRRM